MSAAAVGAAAAVGSLAYGISQSGGDAPAQPNYAAATKEGIVTNASLLPYMKQVDAAAKLGIKLKVTDPETGEPKELDFTGLGDGDTAAAYADKMAKAALELQQKYGTQFVEQARAQLKAADPEGFAARERLHQEVMAELDRPVDSPVADTLEAQILAELQAGGATDAATNREIDQYLVGQQLERGGSYGKADEFQRAMSVGQAAEARRAARQQKGMAFLTGGWSKADREYRKNQQGMANLSAFLSGTTPTAQFQQLSGAQNGAAPFVPGAPGPTLNPGAGADAAQFAQGNYQSQLAHPSPNIWLQGIGLGLQGLGTAATVGGPQGFGWWGAGSGGGKANFSYPSAKSGNWWV